jgi:phosphoglycolate phosphatase-like HAD superfamily hydrolase
LRNLQHNGRILLLFDVDGTLIKTHGRGRLALTAAAEAEFQRPIEIYFKDFAGSTDRRIILEMISKNGIKVEDVESAIDRVLARYVELLKPQMASPESVIVLPGVKTLLEAISQDGEFAPGLLTGNIEQGARIKLNPAGLNPYFAFGAYGDDDADRNKLPAFARQRAEQMYRKNFAPEQTWIIGDTPKDVDCGKANGLHTLAVATSAWSAEELVEHQPDAVLLNLADTERILRIFRSQRL